MGQGVVGSTHIWSLYQISLKGRYSICLQLLNSCIHILQGAKQWKFIWCPRYIFNLNTQKCPTDHLMWLIFEQCGPVTHKIFIGYFTFLLSCAGIWERFSNLKLTIDIVCKEQLHWPSGICIHVLSGWPIISITVKNCCLLPVCELVSFLSSVLIVSVICIWCHQVLYFF